ncbi:Crp/Fnr family transcriptional regulator [Candidatus Saccharibacteria bacterium]|nr:Crp/Fnr family transcriptional regulator [Candidatus Saccharibacteria bacterium]
MHSCLAKVQIFQHLSPEDMDHVHQFIRPKRFHKGESVQLAGHYNPELLILNRGNVKVYRGDEVGNEQIIRLLKPGDYLGEVAVFTESAVQYDAVALEDSTFCTLDKKHLHQMLLAYPELGMKILGDMSQRLQSAETQLESLGQKPAEQRLLDILRQYSNGEKTFTLPISKKDLASQIGIRPETLSRQFSRLQDNDLIKINGKTITLL